MLFFTNLQPNKSNSYLCWPNPPRYAGEESSTRFLTSAIDSPGLAWLPHWSLPLMSLKLQRRQAGTPV